MIQADIFEVISQDAGVIAIAGTRIYPIRLPRDAVLPALVYKIPGLSPVNSLAGDSGADVSTLQVVAWAKDYLKAHELAAACRAALVGSNLKVNTESRDDDEDLETHNYSVITNFNVWGAS